MQSNLLQGLSRLTARELGRRLRRYLHNGNASENELALIRELLRRSRRAAAAQLLVREMQGPCRPRSA